MSHVGTQKFNLEEGKDVSSCLSVFCASAEACTEFKTDAFLGSLVSICAEERARREVITFVQIRRWCVAVLL